MSEPKKENRVKLYIPRGASNEEPNLFISINGVNYLLPRGKESLVPKEVADEYERSLRAANVGERNKDRMVSR